MLNIIVTTQHRGVWFAQVDKNEDISLSDPNKTIRNLKGAKMAIYWGTNKGLHQLCDTGPTESSRISSPTDILTLPDCTGVFLVTDKAAAVWLSR